MLTYISDCQHLSTVSIYLNIYIEIVQILSETRNLKFWPFGSYYDMCLFLCLRIALLR